MLKYGYDIFGFNEGKFHQFSETMLTLLIWMEPNFVTLPTTVMMYMYYKMPIHFVLIVINIQTKL